MEVIVNGNKTTVTAKSVLEFIKSLDIDPLKVAVELNLDILPKDHYGTTGLRDGDRLEIVTFVGGG